MKAELEAQDVVTKKADGSDGDVRRIWLLAGATALAGALLVLLVLSGIAGRPGSKAFSYSMDLVGRHVMAIVLVATAVGVATVVFQTITANRILTPALMGFDAMFVLIQSVLVFIAPGLHAAAAGSLAGFLFETAVMVATSTALYFWLIGGMRTGVHTLLLVGIVVGVFARSVAAMFQRLLDPASYLQLQDSMFASFRNVTTEVLATAAVLVVAALVVLAVLGSRLDVMLLGRETAISLGVDHRAVTLVVLVVVSVLVSASTALIGPVTFFGLLVAHGAYRLTRTMRHRFTLPAAALLGVIALAGGELVLRQLHLESALSVIVEFVGGALLLYLLLSRKGTS